MRKGLFLLLLAAAACTPPASAADSKAGHQFGRADPVNLRGAKLYDSLGPAQLGNTMTSTHSLASGDTGVAGKLEVDGAAYLDGTLDVAGAATLASATITSATLTTATIGDGGTLALARQASVATANVNVTTKTTLWTCPTGKTCVVTDVVFGPSSTTLATADCAFGWNASANDVIATAVRAITTTTAIKAQPIATTVGAKVGAAADVFGIKCGTAEGSAATARVTVLGFSY